MAEEKQVFSIDVAGRTFSVEIGELAKQANGAALVHYGDTTVLSTATGSKEPKDLPFFPLTRTTKSVYTLLVRSLEVSLNGKDVRVTKQSLHPA